MAEKRGSNRSYMEEEARKDSTIDVIRGRRLLLATATRMLDNAPNICFPIADLWDGRLVASIFDAVSKNKAV